MNDLVKPNIDFVGETEIPDTNENPILVDTSVPFENLRLVSDYVSRRNVEDEDVKPASSSIESNLRNEVRLFQAAYTRFSIDRTVNLIKMINSIEQTLTADSRISDLDNEDLIRLRSQMVNEISSLIENISQAVKIPEIKAFKSKPTEANNREKNASREVLRDLMDVIDRELERRSKPELKLVHSK